MIVRHLMLMTISVATLNRVCSVVFQMCQVLNFNTNGLVAEDCKGDCHPTACIPTKRLGNVIGKLPCLKVEVAASSLSY